MGKDELPETKVQQYVLISLGLLQRNLTSSFYETVLYENIRFHVKATGVCGRKGTKTSSCPMKGDSPIHNISFSDVMIDAPAWHHKSCCVNGATSLSNDLSWSDITMKCEN